jgi:hypothetical protein
MALGLVPFYSPQDKIAIIGRTYLINDRFMRPGRAGYPHIHSYPQREKRSKKEKFTTTATISILTERTTVIIIGTVRVSAYRR